MTLGKEVENERVFSHHWILFYLLQPFKLLFELSQVGPLWGFVDVETEIDHLRILQLSQPTLETEFLLDLFLRFLQRLKFLVGLLLSLEVFFRKVLVFEVFIEDRVQEHP